MKKFLLPLLSLVVALGASAGGFAKQKAAKANVKPLAETEVMELQMSVVLSALYDDANYKVPNFYIILADNENSRYDSNTGDITAPANTFTLTLDLFANPDDNGLALPAGTFNMLDDDDNPRIFGYTHEYSMLNFYDYSSSQISLQLENPVDITCDEDGTYHISTLVDNGEGDLVRVTYDGPLVLRTATEKPTVYPQMKKNVTADLNMGGLAIYQGVTDYSNNGVSYLNLYNVEFNAEDGSMLGEGLNLCMLIGHKRYRNANYQVTPGEYTNSMGLGRDTWYPAREITYMTFTYPFGSYLRELKIVNGQKQYTYAYLKEGTFTVIDNGDGTYKGTLSATTTLGYSVELTWSGKVELDAHAQVPTGVSDLDDDVDLDFSKLDFGRIYHTGIMGGCRTFIVDLGSPGGKDEAINYGGDLLRMEFLSDPQQHLLQPGVYSVVPRRWNSDELRAGGKYEPGSLNKGYFNGTGDMIGTRYFHFENGRYCVYDHGAPADDGYVIVDTEDYINYTFEIYLIDDIEFRITGKWDNKPLQYCYNADAVKEAIDEENNLADIKHIGTDSESAVKAVVEGSNILVLNAGNKPVSIFDVEGRLVLSTTADKVIPAAGFGHGIFIIKVEDTTVKVAL